MKRKNIEKKLKTEAERFSPDPLEKIKTAARAENLLPDEPEGDLNVYAQGNTAVLAKGKRKAVWLFTVFVSVLVGLIFIWSVAFNFGKNKPMDPPRFTLSVENVYGMGAVSSVRLLGSNMPIGAVASFSSMNAVVHTAASNSPEDAVKRQAKRFNEYFTAFDSFLGDDIVSTSTEKNPDGQYPYEMKMTITGKDLAGKTISYVMYYTETLGNSEYDEDEDEDEEENEETEKEYQLVGVMVVDGVDYHLEGERSVETEQDESETELKIRAYADITDKTSYIQMEQEYSVEDGETETEYVYSVYANGELLEQTAVEFETEQKNNKVETEYELEFRSGASKGKYVVKREVKENKSEIKVKYDIDGKTGVFHIREVTDKNGNKQYEYSYNDGSKQVFD